MPITTVTCIEDADERQNESNFVSSRGYIDLLQHTSTGNARTGAWLFQVPDTVVIDDITNVEMSFTRANTTGTYGDLTVESDAASLAVGLTSRFTSAESQNGSVAWDPVGGSTGDPASSVDFATPLKSALNNSTASGGYYTVAVIFKADIGAPVSLRIADIEHATYDPATLVITIAAPTNFDAELDGEISTQTTIDALLVDEDVDYSVVSTLGSGDGAGARKLDVYPARNGEPGSNGFPSIVFAHGGRWIEGSKSLGMTENNLSRNLVTKMIDEGYNFVSVEYRKVQSNINPGAIYRSFPQNVHDIYASLKWLELNSSNYNADSTRVVVSGYSAGGHLAAFAGLVANNSDSTTYNGSQNDAGDRPAGYGYEDDADPWQFDFDENGELSLSNPPIGIMLWDAPIDLWEVATMSGGAGAANTNARRALMGETQLNTVSSTKDEADINHYIAGDGNIFNSAQNAASIPPIFFVYSTNEDLVSNEASIDALDSSLNSIGYDVSTASGVLNPNNGLTRHGVARDHADVLRGQDADFPMELEWLAVVSASSGSTHYVGTNTIAAIRLGSASVGKAYLGENQIWP